MIPTALRNNVSFLTNTPFSDLEIANYFQSNPDYKGIIELWEKRGRISNLEIEAGLLKYKGQKVGTSSVEYCKTPEIPDNIQAVQANCNGESFKGEEDVEKFMEIIDSLRDSHESGGFLNLVAVPNHPKIFEHLKSKSLNYYSYNLFQKTNGVGLVNLVAFPSSYGTPKSVRFLPDPEGFTDYSQFAKKKPSKPPTLALYGLLALEFDDFVIGADYVPSIRSGVQRIKSHHNLLKVLQATFPKKPVFIGGDRQNFGLNGQVPCFLNSEMLTADFAFSLVNTFSFLPLGLLKFAENSRQELVVKSELSAQYGFLESNPEKSSISKSVSIKGVKIRPDWVMNIYADTITSNAPVISKWMNLHPSLDHLSCLYSFSRSGSKTYLDSVEQINPNQIRNNIDRVLSRASMLYLLNIAVVILLGVPGLGYPARILALNVLDSIGFEHPKILQNYSKKIADKLDI